MGSPLIAGRALSSPSPIARPTRRMDDAPAPWTGGVPEMAGMENHPERAGIQETLSPGEESFERWRRVVGLFLGPLVAIILLLADLPGLGRDAHVLAGILGWVVVWWICE